MLPVTKRLSQGNNECCWMVICTYIHMLKYTLTEYSTLQNFQRKTFTVVVLWIYIQTDNLKKECFMCICIFPCGRIIEGSTNVYIFQTGMRLVSWNYFGLWVSMCASFMDFSASQLLYMTLAVDKIDGRGLSNTAFRKCPPRRPWY